ncbi:MAG: histidine phosphatase family protein [Bacillota bacterium]|nr:histidine phosphatase family protein [Bacillota bacterium]
MELYLVRHGETESNLERRYQGWTESPLSDNGIRQAEQTGFFLAGEGIELLYCSDLKRAVNTAKVIGSSCGVQPEISPLLREINFGKWEGLTFNEIEAAWGKDISLWLDDPFRRSAPEGETLGQVCSRMYTFLENLDSTIPEGARIAAVSHGGSIRALLFRVLNLDNASFWDIKIDNASVSLIQKENGRFKVAYYNRTQHLESGNYSEEIIDAD